MSKWKLTQWCVHATDQIIYPPDREAVQKELRDHLEDKFEGYSERGFSEEEAVAQILADMGSAKELAPILGEIHRPFWGYACAISGWMVKILAFMVLLLTIRFCVNFAFDYYSPITYQHFDPYSAENPTISGTTRAMVHYTEPTHTVYADGYWFSVEKAAQWHYTPDGTDPDLTDRDDLYFHLKVTWLPWLLPSSAPDFFWAVDSEGNHYYSMYESYSGGSLPDMMGSPHRTWPFTCTYEMWIYDLIDPDAEWIDLHYDRSGRNLALRIDLKGGEAE